MRDAVMTNANISEGWVASGTGSSLFPKDPGRAHRGPRGGHTHRVTGTTKAESGGKSGENHPSGEVAEKRELGQLHV